MNIKIEYKYIYKNNIFIVSAAYLFKSFCHISFYRQRDSKIKVCTCGRLVTIFHFTWPVDRKQTTFKIALRVYIYCQLPSLLFHWSYRLSGRYLKTVFWKYFSCDKACQFSALYGIFWQGYIKKLAIGKKYVKNKFSVLCIKWFVSPNLIAKIIKIIYNNKDASYKSV